MPPGHRLPHPASRPYRLPTDPPPQPLPPGVYPIIGPELATYGVVQPIARQLGFTMLGTLHERIGDTLTVENAGADAEGWGRSGWARFFGQQIDNHYQAFADPQRHRPAVRLPGRRSISGAAVSSPAIAMPRASTSPMAMPTWT